MKVEVRQLSSRLCKWTGLKAFVVERKLEGITGSTVGCFCPGRVNGRDIVQHDFGSRRSTVEIGDLELVVIEVT